MNHIDKSNLLSVLENYLKSGEEKPKQLQDICLEVEKKCKLSPEGAEQAVNYELKDLIKDKCVAKDKVDHGKYKYLKPFPKRILPTIVPADI